MKYLYNALQNIRNLLYYAKEGNMTSSPNPDDKVLRFIERLNRRVIKHVLKNAKQRQKERNKLGGGKSGRKGKDPMG